MQPTLQYNYFSWTFKKVERCKITENRSSVTIRKMFVVRANKYEKLNTLILCIENTLIVGPNVFRRLDSQTGLADWTRRLDSHTGLADWTRRLDSQTGLADWTRRLDLCTELNSFLTVIQELSSSCTTGNTIIKLKLLKLLFLQSYRVRECTNLIECLQNMCTCAY